MLLWAPPPPWMVVEDAIATWAGGVTTSDESPVLALWMNQGGPYDGGVYPAIALNVVSLPMVGRDRRTDFDATRPLNQEIRVERRTVFELNISVQAYTDTANVIGQDSAYAIMARLVARLEDDAVRAELRAAGLGVLAPGTIRNLPELFQTGFEGRAQCDFKFLVTEQVARYVGYFATVKGRIRFNPGALDQRDQNFEAPL
jgi:hypothetical protein